MCIACARSLEHGSDESFYALFSVHTCAISSGGSFMFIGCSLVAVVGLGDGEVVDTKDHR